MGKLGFGIGLGVGFLVAELIAYYYETKIEK